MRIRFLVPYLGLAAVLFALLGCGHGPSQDDGYQGLRNARKYGKRSDIHKELMRKLEGSRDVEELGRKLKEAEEKSR